MLQRSEEWFKARRGRFTASDIHRIIKTKKKIGNGYTASSIASVDEIAKEKACEIIFGINSEDQFISYDMQRGIDLESVAFESFKRKKSLDFIDVKNCSFFPFGSFAGASPDGLVGDDDLLEIKCPKIKTFFNVVLEDYIDVKHYYQMQMQLICTGRKKCHYYVFTVFNGKEYSHEIIVERNEDVIKEIIDSLGDAIARRDYFIGLFKRKLEKI